MEKRKINVEEKNRNILDYQKENVTYEFVLPDMNSQDTKKKENKAKKELTQSRS